MDIIRSQYLLDQYKKGVSSPEEKRELWEIVRMHQSEDWLKGEIDREMLRAETLSNSFPVIINEVDAKQILQTIFEEQTNSTPGAHRIRFLKTTWFRYAAAVILVFGATAYFWKANRKTERTLVSDTKRLQTDVVPGHDRAILTLANGQQIILDSTQGNIVKQGGLTVVNLAGKLHYEGVGTNAEYNTISTPKGGQYQIVLPDGSNVWLNAASSIKFPTTFTGSVRQVEMTGEAYMEIARNPKQSFIVKANGTEIQVLATSFNVNAYEDESAVKTTLIEGSVKVRTTTAVVVSSHQQLKKAVVLKPGQQAVVVSSNQQLKIIDNTDIEQTLAWKNGVFQFNWTNLAEAMRQIARWYDIEVVYENGVPDIKLEGEMKRDLSLFQMMKGLNKLGVNFRIEGKKLIVLP